MEEDKRYFDALRKHHELDSKFHEEIKSELKDLKEMVLEIRIGQAAMMERNRSQDERLGELTQSIGRMGEDIVSLKETRAKQNADLKALSKKNAGVGAAAGSLASFIVSIIVGVLAYLGFGPN